MKTSEKIRISIGTKLVGLIALLLIVSVVSLVVLATKLFVQDNTALIQQMNADTASSVSTQARDLFSSLTEKMRLVAIGEKSGVGQEVFSKDPDFLAVHVFKHDNVPAGENTASIGDEAGTKSLAVILSHPELKLEAVSHGEVQVVTAKLLDGSLVLLIAIPYIELEGKFTHTLVGVVKQSKFIKIFGESDLVTSFMVDRKGRLMAHPDPARVAAGENVSEIGVVQQLLEGKMSNGQTRYVDPTTKEARLGAFRVVGFSGLGVVSEVAEAKAFEAAKRVEYRAALLGVIVLSLAFLAGYFFSGTITWPIKQLVEASRRIAEGDFKIALKPRARDEIGHLALAFNEMAQGLEERDRVKSTFSKFHSKEIADKLLSGEVQLGGERINATIFFSDVRGFTGMSESMQPEQVVEMLNEYMTCMVSVIQAHGGVVDKYVGDAIMALWGVPLGHGDDIVQAVRACLGMRMALAKLNELRLARGQPALKIGMGVNTGSVIAGNIGSDQKMEYTVIGDSVNLASRIESMTKEYGTDLLLSKSVYEVVKDKFVIETCKTAKVKGKSEAIEVFKVRGYIDEKGQEVILETPYSSYEAEKSDKVVHEKPPVEEAPVAVVIPAPAPVLELVSTAFVEEALGLASPPAIPEGAPESVRNEKTAGWWRKAA